MKVSHPHLKQLVSFEALLLRTNRDYPIEINVFLILLINPIYCISVYVHIYLDNSIFKSTLLNGKLSVNM